MADVNYDNIPSIIGIYEGTVAEFEAITNKSNFYGRLILITGTDADKNQAMWTSEDDGSNAHYLNMSDVATLKAQLAHVDSLAFPNKENPNKYDTYDLTGGKGFVFKGSNGITVTLNPSTAETIDDKPYWFIEVNGETLQNSINSVNNTATSALNKANANGIAITNLGTEVSNIQSSLENYATDEELAAVKSEIVGVSSDQISANIMSLHSVKNYALAAAMTAKSEAITEAQEYADTKDITIDSTNTNSTLAGKFVIKKNGVELATINIPKELVVTKDGSEIVKGTWSGDTFTESETGADKALKLAIQNQTTPIYINVADLVDVYTASSAASDVKISISDDNVISATITAVSGTKIIPNTIDKDKLVDAVKASLDKADSAIVVLDGDDYIGVENVGATTTDKKITAKTAEITSETATTDGLATVADIRAYLAARFSVKVVS